MAKKWSAKDRLSVLQKAEREGVDVIVIGGGITGAGVMRDATSRGLKVLLVEKADFVFQPDVLGLHWSQFDKFDELLENGLLEGKQNIGRLIDRLKHHKSWRFRLKQKLFKMN